MILSNQTGYRSTTASVMDLERDQIEQILVLQCLNDLYLGPSRNGGLFTVKIVVIHHDYNALDGCCRDLEEPRVITDISQRGHM